MVTNVTSLTGNGLKDWVIQRATAVYFAVYSLYLFGFLLWHPNMPYAEWSLLFHGFGFRIASLLALLLLSLHTWIGVWTVTTDYIKSTAVRLPLQVCVVIGLLAQFILGFLIIWGQS